MNKTKKTTRRTSNKKRKPSKTTKRAQERNRSIFLILLCVFCVASAIVLGVFLLRSAKAKEAEKIAALQNSEEAWEGAPPIDVELLTPNPNSRPQIPLEKVNGIVIHYTANPGATAIDNRNYFENLKDSGENQVSSHFVVGLDGEVVQCIPSSEISYASNSRNSDTLSIECCHPDETGKYNDATYESVVQLTAWLCKRFDVSVENVIRHYDVTGKNCPKYFVENPDAWAKMKVDIQSRLDELNAM